MQIFLKKETKSILQFEISEISNKVSDFSL